MAINQKGKAQESCGVKNQGFDFCGHVIFGKPSKWRCQVAVDLERLEFRGTVKPGNINLDHEYIDVERGREEIFEGLALGLTNLRSEDEKNPSKDLERDRQ